MRITGNQVVFRLLIGVLVLEVLYLGYSIARSTLALDQHRSAQVSSVNPVAMRTAPATSEPKVPVALTTYVDSGSFTYGGKWERVHGLRDGRRNGTSARSFHPGDRASFTFSGRFVIIFGVVGPGGGRGIIDIDGRGQDIMDFHARKKKAGELIYESPLLARGTHRVNITVAPNDASTGKRNGYVNLDGAYFGT